MNDRGWLLLFYYSNAFIYVCVICWSMAALCVLWLLLTYICEGRDDIQVVRRLDIKVCTASCFYMNKCSGRTRLKSLVWDENCVLGKTNVCARWHFHWQRLFEPCVLCRDGDRVSSIEPHYPGPRFTAAVKQDARRVMRCFNWWSVPVHLYLLMRCVLSAPPSTHIWVGVCERSVLFCQVLWTVGWSDLVRLDKRAKSQAAMMGALRSGISLNRERSSRIFSFCEEH